MDNTKKLYIALALLAVLGGAIYLQNKKQVAEERAYSYEAKNADLPAISITEETRKAIDSIEITRVEEKKDKDSEAKAEGEGEHPAVEAAPKLETVALKKKAEDSWELSKPVPYAANNTNVKSLLENLDKLKVSEQISASAADYEKWGLSDDKALHAVFKKGEEKVLDVYFGENGSRGQMIRIAGKDGVYAVKGFSKYLYSRDIAAWRDKAIFKIEDKAVNKVTVENEHGTFLFEKVGDKWKGQHKDKPTAPAKDIPDFKPTKVDDLVRAFKGLNASEFGDGKTPAEVGLDKPVGTVTLELSSGEPKQYVAQFGSTSEGASRWVKASTTQQIFSVSSWTADWALAEVSKFQEKKEEKKDGKESAGAGGAGPGMGMPPGLGGPGGPGGDPHGH